MLDSPELCWLETRPLMRFLWFSLWFRARVLGLKINQWSQLNGSPRGGGGALPLVYRGACEAENILLKSAAAGLTRARRFLESKATPYVRLSSGVGRWTVYTKYIEKHRVTIAAGTSCFWSIMTQYCGEGCVYRLITILWDTLTGYCSPLVGQPLWSIW